MTAKSADTAALPPVSAPDVRPDRSATARLLLRLIPGVAGAGVVSWCVDTGVLYVGHTYGHVRTPVAAALGFAIGGVVNFVLNRRFFGGRGAPASGDVGRYTLLFLGNLALVTVLVPLVATAVGELIHTPARLLVAKVLVTAVLLPVNALAYHFWVFKA